MLFDFSEYKVKYYDSTKWLHYPDISIDKSKCTCIMGKSGSGKTTFLNSFLKESFPGIVSYNKADILNKDIRSWGNEIYKYISYMPQFAQNSFHPSIIIRKQIEMVKAYNTCISDDKAEKYLEDLELDDSIIERYPFEISGGMKQRLALYIGFIKNPALFILDEPSSALDYITLSNITDFLIERKREGCSMLVVSHHRGFAEKISDSIISLEEGV